MIINNNILQMLGKQIAYDNRVSLSTMSISNGRLVTGGSGNNTNSTNVNNTQITNAKVSSLQNMANIWSTMVCSNYTQTSARTSFGNWLATRKFANCDCSSAFGGFYKHFFGVLGASHWTGSLRDSAKSKVLLGYQSLVNYTFKPGDAIIWVKDSNHGVTSHVDMMISGGKGTTAQLRGFGTAPYSWASINNGRPTMQQAINSGRTNRHYAWVCRYV